MRGGRQWTVWSRGRDGVWRNVAGSGTRAEMEESARWYREQGSDMLALPVGKVPDDGTRP